MNIDPAKLPGFIRRRMEQAIHASANPKGMGVHDGTVRVHGADLAYMLKLIDALSAVQSDREGRKKDASPAPVTDERIRQIAIDHFRNNGDDEQPSTWGPDSLNEMWLQEVGAMRKMAMEAEEQKRRYGGYLVFSAFAQAMTPAVVLSLIEAAEAAQKALSVLEDYEAMRYHDTKGQEAIAALRSSLEKLGKK